MAVPRKADPGQAKLLGHRTPPGKAIISGKKKGGENIGPGTKAGVILKPAEDNKQGDPKTTDACRRDPTTMKRLPAIS